MATEIESGIVEELQQRELEDFAIFDEKEIVGNLALNTPYRPEHFSILLFKEGEMKLSHNLIDYNISKNHLLLLPPKSFYQIESISPDSKLSVMLFKENYFLEAGIHLNIGIVIDLLKADIRKSFVLENDDLETLACLFNLLHKKHRAKDRNLVDQKVITHCFSTIIFQCGSLLTQYNTLYKAKLNRKEELALRFLELVAAHFEEERSVIFFANLLHVTPKYLTEVIKEVTGKTASKLIDQAVITQAKFLLRNPSLNIGEVAATLHFSDQSFFGKFFKKNVGASPLNYRSGFSMQTDF